MAEDKQLHLAFVLQGAGRNWGDWRHPKWQADGSVNIEHYIDLARRAEAAKYDLLFVTDSVNVDDKSGPHNLNRFEPLTILAALATVTSKIGLIGTASTSYSQPYTLARQFASVDMISGGRAGWNIVTTMASAAAANFGYEVHPEPEVRYRMASEHVEIARGLWDSWEDDAFPRNKETGQFFIPEKLHALNHKGEFYSVAGPLSIARSPQSQPVLFQAGASGPGKAFAAKYADCVFIAPATIEESREFYGQTKKSVAEAGRDPKLVKVMPSAMAIVGRTQEEADAFYQEAMAGIRLEDALAALFWRFDGVPIEGLDPHGPMPEIPEQILRSKPSFVHEAVEEAKEKNLSIADVAYKITAPSHHFCGTYQKVGDAMIEWLDTGAADGFMMYETIPGQLDMFAQYLIPYLQERGRFRKEYEGNTLRSHLGLPFIENRHAVAKSDAEI